LVSGAFSNHAIFANQFVKAVPVDQWYSTWGLRIPGDSREDFQEYLDAS